MMRLLCNSGNVEPSLMREDDAIIVREEHGDCW